jgi:lysozyme
MSYRDKLRPILRADEGEKLTAYPDPLTGAEPWTVGVGHTGPEVHKGMTISPEQSSIYLEKDIDVAEATARKLVSSFDTLSDARKCAVVSMAFNLGEKRLSGFVMTLGAINNGKFAEAANGMVGSLWAKQVKGRADRLAQMMRVG